MPDEVVSIDEFLSERKDFVKSGDVLMKAARAPTTWNPEKRSARFVMSSEVEDRDRDIILQAGLDLTGFLKNPVAPFSHKSKDFPVGSWANVEQNLTSRPKRTEGDLVLIEEGIDGVADRLAGHLAAGTIRACSIGFIPTEVKRREAPDDRRDSCYWPGFIIEAAELVECSPCLIPSNPAALAKSAADGDVMAREMIEEVLDTWAKHPETGLLIPRSEFEAAYKQATGERTSVSKIPLEFDASPAEAEIERVSGLLDGLGQRMRKIFGHREQEPGTPAVAEAAAVEAARKRLEALEGRMSAKGLTN